MIDGSFAIARNLSVIRVVATLNENALHVRTRLVEAGAHEIHDQRESLAHGGVELVEPADRVSGNAVGSGPPGLHQHFPRAPGLADADEATFAEPLKSACVSS